MRAAKFKDMRSIDSNISDIQVETLGVVLEAIMIPLVKQVMLEIIDTTQRILRSLKVLKSWMVAEKIDSSVDIMGC